MAIIEIIGGPITHRYLMGRSKDQLATMYMQALSVIDKCARDGDTALLDWIESQYKSTSVQMSGIATYVATGQALRQLRGRSFRDAIRRAMGGIKHGVNCEKVVHRDDGYLHAGDDDSPFDVDGAPYCGRCHRAMGGDQ